MLIGTKLLLPRLNIVIISGRRREPEDTIDEEVMKRDSEKGEVLDGYTNCIHYYKSINIKHT